MTPDAEGNRPEADLPTPSGLALSTLLITVVLLAALFGVSWALDTVFRTLGFAPSAPPALGLVTMFGVQRMVAVHLRLPPRRGRAAAAAVLTGLTVAAVIVVGTHLTAPADSAVVVHAAAQLVALPSAAAVYAWVLRDGS